MLRPDIHFNFKIDELPSSEHKDAAVIKNNILGMWSKATDYWCAHNLFCHCEFNRNTTPKPMNSIYDRWMIVAARDCVMSVYHFGRFIEGIDKSIGQCNTLKSVIDMKSIKSARRKFTTEFPFYITMRHAIAHDAERSSTSAESKKHGVFGETEIDIAPGIPKIILSSGSSFLLKHGIHDKTFHSMWDGKFVSCKITEETGEILDKIFGEYMSIFTPIIDTTPEPPPTVTVSEQPPQL